MVDHEVAVPENVRRNAVELFDSAGWLDALPDTVAALCERWELILDGPAMEGGNLSYAAPVRRADGSPAVLKVALPDEESAAEPTALHHYAGDGAVLLFAYAPEANALLLERAMPGTALVDQPDRFAAWSTASTLLRRLWRVPGEAPDGYPAIPRVADLAAEWARTLPERWREPFPEDLVRQAAELAGEYVVPDGPEGLGNRDNHLGNFLSAEREPWLLIDPKPVIGERAFDAGFLLARNEEDPTGRRAREVLARVADGLGVDPGRAAGWGFIRAVSTGLWKVESGGAWAEWLTAAENLAGMTHG